MTSADPKTSTTAPAVKARRGAEEGRARQGRHTLERHSAAVERLGRRQMTITTDRSDGARS
jgi:hypothetical protein